MLSFLCLSLSFTFGSAEAFDVVKVDLVCAFCRVSGVETSLTSGMYITTRQLLVIGQGGIIGGWFRVSLTLSFSVCRCLGAIIDWAGRLGGREAGLLMSAEAERAPPAAAAIMKIRLITIQSLSS